MEVTCHPRLGGRERPSKQPSGLLQRTACGSRNVMEAGVTVISASLFISDKHPLQPSHYGQ